MKKETKKAIQDFVAGGPKQPGTWEELATVIMAKEGIDPGERLGECADHAGRSVRGFYPNRDRVWEEAFSTDSPGYDGEILHIFDLMMFQIKFTLEKRPEPPKKVSKAKAKEGAPVPPPPPAPPELEKAAS